MTQCYPPSRIVVTTQGKVQGRRLIHVGERQVDAFQGIPFAAPPVGTLRLRKPQPPESWEGVRETTQFDARCIQVEFPGVPLRGEMSEDCLYLNVFTPCWEAAEGGFPVMVFIHGGGFACGEASSYGDIGICENIVTRGVVFVTMQYRLGYLGFLSTGDAVCPGNLALWDQTEALKWVQANISAFGGNKNNVTLMGQSAGGSSVDLLHLSPHSTNLFHKAICMAGSAEHTWTIRTREVMAAQSVRKAERLGVGEYANSEELLDKLRQIPAEKFAVNLHASEQEGKVVFETGPCIDGDFLPEPIDLLRAKATPKPLLNGVTKEEGLVIWNEWNQALADRLHGKVTLELETYGNFAVPGRQLTTAEDLAEILKYAVLGYRVTEPDELKLELCGRYIGNAKPEDEAYATKLTEMMSDAIFVASHLELCRKAVALETEPIYLYVFEHFAGPAILGAIGPMLPFQDATHTNELFHLFKKGFFADPEMTETDKKVMNTFTNFAKCGNPNGHCETTSILPALWKPITKKNPELNYVFTSDGATMRNDLFEGRTATFVDILNKHK